MIPDHGNHQKKRTLLTNIYLNELKVKIFLKYSILVPNKLIETEMGKLFYKSMRDIKHLLTRPFATAFNSSFIG